MTVFLSQTPLFFELPPRRNEATNRYRSFAMMELSSSHTWRSLVEPLLRSPPLPWKNC